MALLFLVCRRKNTFELLVLKDDFLELLVVQQNTVWKVLEALEPLVFDLLESLIPVDHHVIVDVVYRKVNILKETISDYDSEL